MANYTYELRQGDVVVAAGYLSRDVPFEVGERVAINEREGIVQSVDATLVPKQELLVVQLIGGG